MRAFPLVVLGLVACGKTKAPAFEGPMPIAFGDCAGATVAWVSGPQPGPFKPEDTDVRIADVTPGPPPSTGPGEAPAPDPNDPALARQRAIEAARNAGIIGSTAIAPGGAFASLTGTGDLGTGFDDSNIYGGLLGDANGTAGWGTIGTGRYGTIGGGRGGSGIGGRRVAVPSLSIGQPTADAGLDKAIIRRYIKRNVQKIQYCYEKRLLAKPALAGTLTAKFTIAESGMVTASTVTGFDPEVSTCVAAVIKDIEFPKPKGVVVLQVAYPMTFRPVGAGATTVPGGGAAVGAGPGSGSGTGSAAGTGTGTGSATATGSGSATARATAAGSGSAAAAAAATATATATGSAAATATGSAAATGSATEPGRVRALFGPTTSWYANYVAGKANPLRGESAAISACMRGNPQHAGVMIVDLVYDAGGKVTTASIEGVADEDTRDCLVEIAQRTQRTGAGPATQHCALAYGALAVADLPGVDITADAIAFAGRTIAQPKLVLADDERATTLPDLATAVAAGVKAAVSAPTLAIHGPIAIRAIDTTPMRVVDRVLASVIAGGDDPVLAIRRGAAWETLPAMALPVVPVPFSTGDTWNHVKPPSSTTALDSEVVILSILVTPTQIWVGVSRIQEFQELPNGPGQLDKLLVALKERKASAFFTDRTDLEIAGEATVTYGEVAKVIDAAATAGFVDWRITEPGRLKAHPSL